MHLPTDIPDLAIVRVLTSGGPFGEGDTVSIAFTAAKIGRLLAHDSVAEEPAPKLAGSLLPETVSAIVTHPAGPYRKGDVLTLSFVDPAIARIHATSRTFEEPQMERRIVEPNVKPARTFEVVSGPPERLVMPVLPQSAERARHGVRISLSWSDERARRFIQVADKLFTVDRLGWYRHAFAMRLLVPDEIVTGDSQADASIAQTLRALRAATLETLGRPLLAAFMPAFSVTPDWLDSIDAVASIRALSDLRSTLLPHADSQAHVPTPGEEQTTVGVLLERDLIEAPGSVESMLPTLIANVSAYDDVTERLTDYRQALIELFGGTAQSAETVRLGQMAQPNHTLDDRLWQLVGVVGERFGGLAVV